MSSIEEAQLAIEHGASAIGLVGAMPSGPGVIDDELIAEIVAVVPPPVATFLLTSRTRPEDVVEHVLMCGVDTVQLVDRVQPDVYAELKRETPRVRIVQVIHVQDRGAIDEAVGVSHLVDALLLDSGDQHAEVRELGGTGRVHDWSISRQIVEHAWCPVFLAGGLSPENVRAAVESVQPFCVDLCNGVRTEGSLDGHKLAALTQALWR